MYKRGQIVCGSTSCHKLLRLDSEQLSTNIHPMCVLWQDWTSVRFQRVLLRDFIHAAQLWFILLESPLVTLILCQSVLECVSAWPAHRFPEGQQDLPSEHVAVVCRRGAVDHDPVAVIQLAHGKVVSDHLVEETGSSVWSHLSTSCQQLETLSPAAAENENSKLV